MRFLAYSPKSPLLERANSAGIHAGRSPLLQSKPLPNTISFVLRD